MLHKVFLVSFLLLAGAQHRPLSVRSVFGAVDEAVTPRPIISNGSYINAMLGKYHSKLRVLARSCKEIRDKYGIQEDGIFLLVTAVGSVYQTFCDMTTAGGGWTLVAGIHDTGLSGQGTTGHHRAPAGNSIRHAAWSGMWGSRATSGLAESATDQDYKSPGYYDINADDVSVWHVPHNEPLEHWSQTSLLRYHTETSFLREHGGNLFQLFKRHPVAYGIKNCSEGQDNGIAVPVVFDLGDKQKTSLLYGPKSRDQFEPGFVSFSVYGKDGSALAMCSGVKPMGCHPQHYCIGGEVPSHYGDVTSSDRSDADTGNWRASTEILQSAVLIFYR